MPREKIKEVWNYGHTNKCWGTNCKKPTGVYGLFCTKCFNKRWNLNNPKK